jgi:hypothetical protein
VDDRLARREGDERTSLMTRNKKETVVAADVRRRKQDSELLVNSALRRRLCEIGFFDRLPALRLRCSLKVRASAAREDWTKVCLA